MSNTILIKRSGTANAVPASGNLSLGELAINYQDGNLFYKDSGGTVQTIASKQFVSVSGNITGANVNTGQLSLSGNVISAINTTSNITTTANVSGNYILGNGYFLTGVITSVANINNGTSNITVVSSGGNITVGVGGVGNVVVFATTGQFTTGVVSASGNVTGGNVLTGGLISATGNITGGNLIGSNLTSTRIPYAGTNKQLTDTTNLTWDNPNQVLFVGAGGTQLGGDAGFGFLSTTRVSATGNVTGGNILTGGLISATGNVTSGNLNAAGLSLSGNVLSALNSTSNITTTANIAANYFIGNGSQLTGVTASSVDANNLTGNTLNSGVIFSSLTTVGTLTSLSVSGNVTGGNILTGGLISSTGNITGGNISTSGSGGNISGANVISGTTLSATANVIGGNITTAGLISSAGTITGTTITGSTLSSTGNVNTVGIVGTGNISTTGNISGGNILTGGLSLSANVISAINTTSNITTTANISGGNLLTVRVSASGNVDGANVNVGTAVYTSNIIGKTNTLTLESVSNGNINLYPNGTGNIVLANTIINGLAEPLQSQDAATKYYVDNAVTTGFAFHQPVFAATNTTLATATGGTITYAQPNGVANGIGATITTTGSFNLIDTANVQTANTRILVKNEANAVLNGVYVWSNATVITRSVDADQYGSDSAESFSINDYFFTQSGNVNAGTAFIVNAPAGVITFGTSNITFAEFSSTQVYSANTSAGISLTGTVFSTKVDNTTTAFDGGGNIVVKASAQLTTPNIGAATGDSLSVTGLITGGNITAGSGYVSTTGNVIGGNITTGGLITATGNIASSANVSGGNILTSGLISATATITGGNLATGGTASATGNITGGNVLTGGLISATGNITTGNINSGGLASITGNITGGNLISGALTQTVNFSISGNVIGNLLPSANATFNLGGPGQLWKDLYLAGNTLYLADQSFTANATGIATANNFAANNLNAVSGITAGTTVSAVGNVIGGNITTVGQLISTQSGNPATGAGQVFLNGAGNNRIDWAAVGTGAPAFNTRSDGTKVVLYPALSGSTADYAIGIDAATMWSSIPENTSGFNFKWYGATTQVASLSGTGVFSALGNITTTANIAGGNILFGAGIVSGTGNITGGNIFQGVNQVLDTASTVDGGLY